MYRPREMMTLMPNYQRITEFKLKVWYYSMTTAMKIFWASYIRGGWDLTRSLKSFKMDPYSLKIFKGIGLHQSEWLKGKTVPIRIILG